MNILVIAPYGMYRNYTSSFIHNQNKAFVQLGHRVRAVVPIAVGKTSNSGKRVSGPLEWVEKDGVEICFVRHLSLGSYGANHFNHRSAKVAVKLFSKQLLQNFLPDVICAHTINHGSPIGCWLKNRCGASLVITTHGGDTDVALRDDTLKSSRRLCEQADAVIGVSPRLLEKLEQLRVQVPRRCIYCGFEGQNVTESPKIAHRVIQVGNLVASKHNDYTLQAVAKLKETYPDVTLTIVGEGAERQRLEALSRELHLTDTVTFLGRLPNPETMAEMAKAEIFVMPSYPEGLGIVYLEAMASGCVAIGTEGEGISAIITSGQDGFLIPRDDIDGIVRTIDNCFRDRKRMAQVAEAGRQRVLPLTWENNAREYEKLFTGLLEARA